jgi:hypothetical protein
MTSSAKELLVQSIKLVLQEQLVEQEPKIRSVLTSRFT